MSYVGRWVFHSIGAMNENDEMIYMGAEEYLDSPMLYIDETDAQAVADEIKERKQIVGGQIAVCEDGKMYMLMPLPEGVSQAEVDAAVSAGHIKIYDGMMTDEPCDWQEREGELWVKPGISEEFLQFSGDGEFLTMATTRYERLQ